MIKPPFPTAASGVIAAMMLTGCASYHPQSLDFDTHHAGLTVDRASLPFPSLGLHRFDPSDGLDMIEVSMLAVSNNPDLKVERAKIGVARAQLFQAGLLPDPQFSAAFDHPTTSGPGLTNAYNIGLGYDLTTLVTRGAGIEAQRAASDQVSLQALWQEWQTLHRARTLYIEVVTNEERIKLLRQTRTLYAQRYAHSSAALRRGDVTLSDAGSDLSALVNAETQLNDAERTLAQSRYDLNALLGLAPDTRLALTPLKDLVPAPAPGLHFDIAAISKRRPDLIALQEGYRSQEAQVRRAVLSQFPSLSLTLNTARDTSAVNTLGIGINITLPLFTRNRGEIAVQRATREQLRQEYQARLKATESEIAALREKDALLRGQLAQIDAHLPALENMARDAEQAYSSHRLDPLTYLNIENTLLSQQSERWNLVQSLWQSAISLDTLAGWPDTGTQEGDSH